MKRSITQLESHWSYTIQVLDLGVTCNIDFFSNNCADIDVGFFYIQSAEREKQSITVSSRRSIFAYVLCQEVI
ncbi:MAG: hypothetical protein BV458_08930 [Thermoplasmata archaeon M9B2D]|nr:MAG: hypothetical protein BV458_08930 [Thermoplasmata archaeon M9B2D]